MKNLKLNIKTLAVLFSVMVLFAACDNDDDNTDMDPMPEESVSIVDIATSDDDFSILVEALSKANLVDALEGDGPFTVFAPTNDAFEMLFETLGVSGVADLSAETLTPILLYHVVGAKAMSTDLTTGYYETISTNTPDEKGMMLYAMVDGGVTLNNSVAVISADIEASNGVVHVVDNVILPPSVVDIAIQNESFSTLVSAVVKAGLVDALSAEGPFTVFAPTNAAFESLFMELNVSGLDDLSGDDLMPILLYHVVADNVLAAEVTEGLVPSLKTDSDISVTITSDGVMLDDRATIVATDIQGSNGVVHVIDQVILPN